MARYEFAGRTVTYSRSTAAGTTVVWQRKLEGWRLAGTGFTLVVPHPTSLQGVLIMHEPSARLDAWLDELGIRPLPAVEASQAARP